MRRRDGKPPLRTPEHNAKIGASNRANRRGVSPTKQAAAKYVAGFHVTKAKYGEEDQNTSDYVEAPPKLRRGAR